jgi:hypothetical protein
MTPDEEERDTALEKEIRAIDPTAEDRMTGPIGVDGNGNLLIVTHEQVLEMIKQGPTITLDPHPDDPPDLNAYDDM